MKQYQLTLSVPDDFDPEQLEIDLSYKDDIEIVNEGYTDDHEILDAITNTIEKKVDLSTLKVDGDIVVLFKFPGELTQFPTYINHLKEALELKTKKPVVGLLDNIDILVQNADESIKMLEEMAGKVKARALILR